MSGGLIGSPPCPTFSRAGKGAGRRDVDHVIECAHELVKGVDRRDEHRAACEDARSLLTVEPLRWALALQPDWIALEQVPDVLPIWELFAQLLAGEGYSTWAGVLSAERYGVPQTRQRAIMLASRVGTVSRPPATHQRYIAPRRREEATLGLFDAPEPDRIVAPEDQHLAPWVSMAQALGWGMTARPSVTLTATNGDGGPRPLDGGAHSRDVLARAAAAGEWAAEDLVGFPRRPPADDVRPGDGDHRARDLRPAAEPAFALTEKSRSWVRFRSNGQPNAAERSIDEPAPTIKGGHDYADRVWIIDGDGVLPTHFRAGTGANDAVRGVDEPAPTLRFGARLNTVTWVVDTGNTRSGTREEGRARPVDAPAPVVTTRADQLEWRDSEPDTTPTHYDSRGQRDSRSGEPKPARQRSTDEPAPTIAGESRNDSWVHNRPATTLAGDPRIARPGHKGDAKKEPDAPRQMEGAIRVSVVEAAILQTFPVAYPWQGTKSKVFQQIGNAVPPLLAFHVLRHLIPDGWTGDVVDLFAGPGGWDVGAHALGLSPLGIEWDGAACETRRAAGLETIQADVSELDPLEVVYPLADEVAAA